jgi:hypothetical protein
MVVCKHGDAAIQTFGRWKGDTWKHFYAAMALATVEKQTNKSETVGAVNPCEKGE